VLVPLLLAGTRFTVPDEGIHSGEGDMSKANTLTGQQMLDEIDRQERHFRNPDRPRADFGLKLKAKPKPIEQRRFNGRVRTASWLAKQE
jgi:hypothetical protein